MLPQAADFPEIHPLPRIAGAGGWRLSLPHADEAARLIWISRGHGSALLDGLAQSVAPQSVVFVPAGGFFALEAGAQLYGVAVRFPESGDDLLPGAAHHLRLASRQAQGELGTLTGAMAREQEAARDFHAAAARAHGALIAIWLRRALLDAAPPPPLRADQRLARDFARALASGPRAGRGVAFHAETLGVTPTHLTRACTRAAGRAAGNLLTGALLHEARRLLADSPHPVGRIATHLGFGSAAYFTRFIKNHTGTSPTRLRAQAAERRRETA